MGEAGVHGLRARFATRNDGGMCEYRGLLAGGVRRAIRKYGRIKGEGSISPRETGEGDPSGGFYIVDGPCPRPRYQYPQGM